MDDRPITEMGAEALAEAYAQCRMYTGNALFQRQGAIIAELRRRDDELAKLKAYIEYVEHLKYKYSIGTIERYNQWLDDYALTRGDDTPTAKDGDA